MRTKTSLILLTFLALPWSLSRAGGLLPVGQAEYEFVYDRLERLDALSVDRFDYQLGPYCFDWIRYPAHPFQQLSEIDSSTICLFGFAGEQFHSRQGSRALGRESLRGGVAARPLGHLFVYANFVLDEARAKDPSYHGKKWRGLAGDVEQGFAQYSSQRFDITLGRFASFWGPRRSLALASNAIMDGLAYQVRLGRLTISYRLARLDGLTPKYDSVPQYEYRYFAGHRVDLHLLANRLNVGLFETVVFGGAGRQIDLFYLNPLIFYHGAQLNEGTEDNTLVGFDITVKPRVGFKLYGQVVIDDLQIEKKVQADQEPNEYGVLLGAYLTDLAPSWDVNAEYSRVTNWTFNQVLPRNRVLFENKPVGNALGNDYDLGSVSLYRWFGESKRASINLSYWRQGEGRVDAIWSAPWLDVIGDYDEPFPTGVVQKTLTASVGFKGFALGHFYIDATAGLDRITNRSHHSGEIRTLPFFNLTLSAFASALLDLSD
ncbi:MAG: capsule assembly Wzi family protein [Candidatus Zixiibacteriota bacterium]